MEKEYSNKEKAPALGEDNALKGFVNQYSAAAELIYKELINNESFEIIILKDFRVEQVDDLVLVSDNEVKGYQIKWSEPTTTINYSKFKEYVQQLYSGFEAIRKICKGRAPSVYLYTSNIASTSSKIKDVANLAHFITEYWEVDDVNNDTLEKWRCVIDDILKCLNIEWDALQAIRASLRFSLNHKRIENREEYDPNSRYYRDIKSLASELIDLAGKQQGKIELSREEILDLMGWRSRQEFKARHIFDIPDHYHPIQKTVSNLEAVFDNYNQGYAAIVGTPGSGKSTLLTMTVRYRHKARIVPYYCFIPDDTAIHARSEAYNFLHDIVLSLKKQGFGRNSLSNSDSIESLRADFQEQINEVSSRYSEDGVVTYILVDGLDHVKREGNPNQSLLKELPNPSAIPDGVLFVLGSQNIDNLELNNEIKSSLYENDGTRMVTMEPLSQQEVREVIKLALPGIFIDSECLEIISQKSGGHPLALNYIINKLNSLDEVKRDQLINIPDYDCNIEEQYNRYWQGLDKYSDVIDLLALMSRMRGKLDFSVIEALAKDESTVRSLISDAEQYFRRDSEFHWSFFHNSFRQFILDKTGRSAFGIENPEKNKIYHNRLAEMAIGKRHSVFRWEYLYHLFHSDDFSEVLNVSTQNYFRQQFFDGRGAESIIDDINYVVKSATIVHDPMAVIRACLIHEEITTRAQSLEDIDFPGYLIDLGKVDQAYTHIYKDRRLLVREYRALSYAGILYDIGFKKEAESIFDLAEPIDEIEGTSLNNVSYSGEDVIERWIEVAPRFRSLDDIISLIDNVNTDNSARFYGDEKDEQVKAHYYRLLIDSVIELGEVDRLEDVSENLERFLSRKVIDNRIAIKCQYSENVDSETKDEKFEKILSDVDIKALPFRYQIDICGKLIKRGELIRARKIFSDISKPATNIDSNHLGPGELSDFYLKIFTYFRVNAALHGAIEPDDAIAVIEGGRSDIRYVARMLVKLSNFWGARLSGNQCTVLELMSCIGSLLQLFDNYSKLNGAGMDGALSGFQKTYMEIIVRICSEFGSDYVDALIQLLEEKWTNASATDLWSSWIRREVLKLLYESGLSKSKYIGYLIQLDVEDGGLEQDKELRELLEDFKDKANSWFNLNCFDRADEFLRKSIDMSFGVSHEKDTQINYWVDIYLDILDYDPGFASKDILQFISGIVTNAKYGRARYSSEAAVKLLSYIAKSFPKNAKILKMFYWDNSIVGFSQSVEAFIISAASNPKLPLSMAVFLYRWLYLPYERHFDSSVLEEVASSIRDCSNRGEALSIFQNLVEGIGLEVAESKRGAYWKTIVEVFECKAGQEELLSIISPLAERNKTKLDHTPGSITLIGGEVIEEESLIDQSKDPDRLIEILEKLDKDGFYSWWRIIKPIAYKLDHERTKKLLEAMLLKNQDGRDVQDLIDKLITFGDDEAAKGYALSFLEKSESHGWSYQYDGGSRIVPYK